MPFQSRPGARALACPGARRRRRDAGLAQTPPTTPASPLQTPPDDAGGTDADAESAGRARHGPCRSTRPCKLALQQNLGIQIERLNPQLQDYTIAQALANYTPVVRRRRELAEPGFSRRAASCRAARRRSPTSNFGFQTQSAQALPLGHGRHGVVRQLARDDEQHVFKRSTRR